jgi:hypothetical protein
LADFVGFGGLSGPVVEYVIIEYNKAVAQVAVEASVAAGRSKKARGGSN